MPSTRQRNAKQEKKMSTKAAANLVRHAPDAGAGVSLCPSLASKLLAWMRENHHPASVPATVANLTALLRDGHVTVTRNRGQRVEWAMHEDCARASGGATPPVLYVHPSVVDAVAGAVRDALPLLDELRCFLAQDSVPSAFDVDRFLFERRYRCKNGIRMSNAKLKHVTPSYPVQVGGADDVRFYLLRTGNGRTSARLAVLHSRRSNHVYVAHVFHSEHAASRADQRYNAHIYSGMWHTRHYCGAARLLEACRASGFRHRELDRCINRILSCVARPRVT